MKQELTTLPKVANALSVYADGNSFEHAQRIAKMLCSSSLVPVEYQNNLSNTLVAMEMANRVGVSPLMVMQNLNVINGRPSWSSPYIIASINTSGRFAPLKFQFEDRGMKKVIYEYWTGSKAQNNRRKETGQLDIRDHACRAVSKDATGDVLEGPWVSIEMAIHEGWYTKSDSKWKTMPEVMLRYRAAAFFGRLYCPEMMMGMQTTEELHDISVTDNRQAGGAPSINSQIVEATTIPQQNVTDHEKNVSQSATIAAPASTDEPQSNGGSGTSARKRGAKPVQPLPPEAAAPPEAADEELV